MGDVHQVLRDLTWRFVESSAMSAHSPTSSCVTSSTTSQSREQPHPAVRRLRAQPEVLHGVLEISTTPSPSSENCVTIRFATYVFPVPGMPEKSLPSRQWATGSSTWIQACCSVEDVLGASPETDEGVHGALSMIKQCGETWAVASRDHSKSAQVAGFPYL